MTMMEVLRGLLNDDPKERWAVSDLMFDMARQNQSPRPCRVKPIGLSSSRTRVPDNPRSLERFRKQLDAAVTPIKDGSLNVWLRRGFSDEELMKASMKR